MVTICKRARNRRWLSIKQKKQEKKKKHGVRDGKNNLCLSRNNIKAWNSVRTNRCLCYYETRIAGGTATRLRCRIIDRWIDDITRSLLLSMVAQRDVIAKKCTSRLKFWHVFRNIISTFSFSLSNTKINLYFLARRNVHLNFSQALQRIASCKDRKSNDKFSNYCKKHLKSSYTCLTNPILFLCV